MTDSKEVWLIKPSPVARVIQRVASALQRRRYRWQQKQALKLPPLEGAPSGPSFSISGFDASFDEIETLLAHPSIRRTMDRPPAAPLAAAEPPALGFPAGHDRIPTRPRDRVAPVYDIVPFGFERDLLELRLLSLDPVVDHFIIVESAYGYGGVRKGICFDGHDPRFAPFAKKLRHIVLDDRVMADASSSRRRGPTDFHGENLFRAGMWRAIREAVVFEPDAVIVHADLDELPPPNLVHWLRSVTTPLPLRLSLPTLRYNFRWLDTDTWAELVCFSPASFDAIDRAPENIRRLPGTSAGATGAVHLTSFLDPLALIAKFAMTTDWEPGILPFIRNEQDETARMIAHGQWFGRPLSPYDPERDPRRLIPRAAVCHKARFERFWGSKPLP